MEIGVFVLSYSETLDVSGIKEFDLPYCITGCGPEILVHLVLILAMGYIVFI